MKPLALRTIIFFSPHRSSSSSFRSLQISHFSSSSHSLYSSSSSSSFSPRRHDEESRNVRVSVLWDFKSCRLPSGNNVFRVGHRITAAVRANGIMGPINITAFGDTMKLSQRNQEALLSTGITLVEIDNGGKKCADRSLVGYLQYLRDWVLYNRPPIHFFLISGERDFAGFLHRLRMKNYNILLAIPGNAPGDLCSAASIMWDWHALMRGENLTGKHFNQPPDGPDGPYGYGHCKVPLEDPFSLNGQSDCSWVEELSEPALDVKPRPIPKLVKKLVSNQGVATVPVTNNGDQNFTTTPKLNSEGRSITKADSGKSSLPPSPEVNVVEPPTKVQEPPPLGKNIEKVINAHVIEGNLPPVEVDSAYEVGFLERIWRKWFIRNDGASRKKSDGIPEECSTFDDSSGKTKSEEERVKSISQSADPVGPGSLSLFSNDSALEDRTARSSEVCGDKCSATPGYFSHIINRCKFWSAGPNSNTSRDQSSERLNQINGHPETHEIFSTDSFWSEMESFIDTPKGSVLVSQSKTRA